MFLDNFNTMSYNKCLVSHPFAFTLSGLKVYDTIGNNSIDEDLQSRHVLYVIIFCKNNFQMQLLILKRAFVILRQITKFTISKDNMLVEDCKLFRNVLEADGDRYAGMIVKNVVLVFALVKYL